MIYYVICPDCGYKLFKAGDCSTIEINYPKHKEIILIAVKDGEVALQKATDYK